MQSSLKNVQLYYLLLKKFTYVKIYENKTRILWLWLWHRHDHRQIKINTCTTCYIVALFQHTQFTNHCKLQERRTRMQSNLMGGSTKDLKNMNIFIISSIAHCTSYRHLSVSIAIACKAKYINHNILIDMFKKIPKE